MLTQQAKALGIHPSCKTIEQLRQEQIDNIWGDTADESEGVLVNVDIDDLKFKELRKIADDKGIKVPFGTSKPDLINLLKGE